MKREGKVLLSVIAALAVLTVCLHFVGDTWLSRDLGHIKQIPAIVRDLAQREPPHVLFLGNSITHADINTDVVAPIWSAAVLSPVTMARIYPDDTNIGDWIYLYRQDVLPAAPQLDLLVVSFANDNLADTTPNYERIGGFGGFAEVPYAFSEDVTSLSGRIRYLLSASSNLWRNKERVQTRVLATLPGYKTLAADVNRSTRAATRDEPVAHHVTYDRLARFLSTVPHDTKVVFVAAPIPTHYVLPDDLRRTITAAGADLIDMQRFDRLDPGDFPDGYHMSPEAAARFSQALAIRLLPILEARFDSQP